MRARKVIMTVVVGLAGFVVAALVIGWAGLQVGSKPFPAYPLASGPIRTVPLREGLPAPVERYFRTLYGDKVPVVETAVVTGRMKLRPFGVWLPGRFRFTHEAGKNYRHYIEATWFNVPFMRVNERYLDGKELMELPWATQEGEKLDQGGNLGMWAELAAYTPSVLVTDPRVAWRPIDEHSALLVVPFGDGHDTFVVRFDPESSLPTIMESMRYQGADSPSKVLWINTTLEYGTRNGHTIGTVGSATWIDTGKPWAVFSVDDVVLNPDVSSYVRGRGL